LPRDFCRLLGLGCPKQAFAKIVARLWFFWGKWLAIDKFNNIENLEEFSGTTAVILAQKDKIIPNRFTLNLYESIVGKKKIWKFAESGHNSVPVSPKSLWCSEVMKFVSNN